MNINLNTKASAVQSYLQQGYGWLHHLRRNHLWRDRATQVTVTLVVLLVVTGYIVARVRESGNRESSFMAIGGAAEGDGAAQLSEGGTAQDYFAAGMKYYRKAKRAEADPLFGSQRLLLHAQPAYDNFDKAVQLDGEFAEARLYRARAGAMVGRSVDEILADLDKAVALKFAYAEAWYERAGVLFQIGRQTDGLASLNRAIEAKPNYFQALTLRGVAYRNAQFWNDALTDLTKAKEVIPENVDPTQAHTLYLNRGFVLYVMGKHEEAISDLTEAIRINQNEAFTYTMRGNAYLMTGQVKGMVEDFERTLRLNPLFIEDIQEELATLNSLLAQQKPGSEEYTMLKGLIDKGATYKPEA